MIYDLNTEIDRERLTKRITALFSARKVVEVKVYQPKRTNAQNRYLHAILGEFAMQTGNTLEETKTEYFKKHCNAELFVVTKSLKHIGTIEVLRSSAELDTAEMTTAIDRFRNWSASEAGIYLPSPDEEAYLAAIEAEMQRHRDWL
jgi:hypothetical protein